MLRRRCDIATCFPPLPSNLVQDLTQMFIYYSDLKKLADGLQANLLLGTT